MDGLSRAERIALVVLFDQFPRNIFRSSGEAFAYDAKAREIARALIRTGIETFFWVERVALVLPFEHSEDMADQDYAVLLAARACGRRAREPSRLLPHPADYATWHRDIIRKFGRFPHRNAVLGRNRPPRRAAFLAEKGRGY